MADINTKVSLWKNKLLDMGKRNKLLNYRDTKRSTLRFKSPEIFDLWQSFVIDENPLEFPFVDEEDSQGEPQNSEPIEVIAESETASNLDDAHSGIVTNQPANERQRTLRNLRTKSKSFMEEQGVNVLYLSFGFLRWSESSSSKDAYDAPLILVPVTLKWESIMSPFVMELHEDDIVLNPTLIYKLENDFRCNLPEFSLDTPLKDYLNQVEKIVAANQWKVIREVSLGMFSFLKINMYRDLEIHRSAILKNPIIRAIAGDASGISHDLSGIDDFDFDRETKPEQVFQVVDADSSQQDAIHCAKEGISFVLQGPPGTGKSQTITNIIAECLADGKKVLFVSEKMAALDVVYNRLAAANLSDFCFVLHSYKANKKQALEQLGMVLQLASKKASISEETFRTLDNLTEHREELNQYVEDVHTIVEPLHQSIYDANGVLSSMQDYDDVIFSLPGIRNTSSAQYNNYLRTLSQFADTISTMKVDYHDNPWRGTKILFLSNELRHDINSRVKSLAESTQSLVAQLDEICTALPFSIADSYSAAKRLLAILQCTKISKPFSSDWILSDDALPFAEEISKCSELKSRFVSKKNELLSILGEVSENDGRISFSQYTVSSMCSSLQELEKCVDAVIEDDSCYVIWKDPSTYSKLDSVCAKAKAAADAFIDVHGQISGSFEREIFEIPYSDIYFRFKTKSASIFRIFNSQYRNDKRLIQNMCLEPGKKLSDEDILNILAKLRKLHDHKTWLAEHRAEVIALLPEYYNDENTDFASIHRHIAAFDLLQKAKTIIAELKLIIEENERQAATLKSHYDQLYTGIETDWDAVRESLEWANTFKQLIGNLANTNERFIMNLATDPSFIAQCEHYADQLDSSLTLMRYNFEWFSQLFEDQQQFNDGRLITLVDRYEACCNNLAALEEWIDIKRIRQRCHDISLDEYVDIIESQKIACEDIVPIFKKRFFRLWLDSVLPDFPAVANFRRRIQDARINEFKQLDKAQFAIAKSRIRYKLINRLPSMDRFTNGADEISILKRELGKQRRIMSIRKLFHQIPNLILTLKPCLMMSPLSVSLYLESECFKFDTVIFDEASQVYTENAIGAIFRGKQVIIAGDSKQLPPTSFFTSAAADSDFDVDMDSDEVMEDNAYESILDEAAMLPARTLLWHYRSRHEHLIAFSNAKIYHNNLITFPSNIDKAPDVGVEYFYVKDGFYDRGGRKGNAIEAEKVAQMVFEHFRKFPKRSLGVISFGEVQQLAIDTAIRKLRQENQMYEEFFNEEQDEPFFVKSLENVQGDERDTIIFSIGYAKDANGVMRMNFGPLSKAGGERRLNVAITRAKYNVKLVGSILPTDIDLSHVSTDGPKLLRSYIDFAQNGPSVLDSEITERDEIQHDSPFEAAVFRFLDNKGYKLATQVGCSGYRIDMAVKHPTLHGRYVLGIECDGASYHSARTARERDRLRQDVLESMGWKIYRIWSTDWIKDPVTEGKKLIDAIEDALASYQEDEQAILLNLPKPAEESQSNDFLKEEDRAVSKIDLSNPYNFNDVPIVNWNGLRKQKGTLRMTYCVMHIIDTTYPVHMDEICQLVAPLLGREKATSVVRKEVTYALMQSHDKYLESNQFYFPSGCDLTDISKIPYRRAGNRQIKYISTEEVASGMLVVAGSCVGATRDGLIAETVRAFGFTRSGPNITNAMNDAFGLLVEKGFIELIDNKVTYIK